MSDTVQLFKSGMPQAPSEQGISRVMGTLYHLALEAFRSPNLEACGFRILNNTIGLIPYEHAALWDLRAGRRRLLGLSGQVQPNENAEMVVAWKRLVAAHPDVESVKRLARADFPESRAEDFQLVEGEHVDAPMLWIPFKSGERLLAGLWLTRQPGHSWTDQEISLLGVLSEGYGAALERHLPDTWFSRWLGRGTMLRKVALVLVLALLVYALFFMPTPLKVIAPCEVVPERPALVAAPLNGVVEELLVNPGDEVKVGDPLFRYDGRVPLQEFAIAKQQVEIIRSQIERATVLALQSRETEDQLDILRERLRQEMARLQLHQSMVDRLLVRSEFAGVVQVQDPFAWRGRPVRVGEQVMRIVNPVATMVRIYIAEEDHLPGLDEQPALVFLRVAPDTSHEARIRFIANAVAPSPAGVPSFLAEANWTAPRRTHTLGLKGTAVLYGEPASLAYWILRKPWATVRSYLGQ